MALVWCHPEPQDLSIPAKSHAVVTTSSVELNTPTQSIQNFHAGKDAGISLEKHVRAGNFRAGVANFHAGGKTNFHAGGNFHAGETNFHAGKTNFHAGENFHAVENSNFDGGENLHAGEEFHAGENFPAGRNLYAGQGENFHASNFHARNNFHCGQSENFYVRKESSFHAKDNNFHSAAENNFHARNFHAGNDENFHAGDQKNFYTGNFHAGQEEDFCADGKKIHADNFHAGKEENFHAGEKNFHAGTFHSGQGENFPAGKENNFHVSNFHSGKEQNFHASDENSFHAGNFHVGSQSQVSTITSCSSSSPASFQTIETTVKFFTKATSAAAPFNYVSNPPTGTLFNNLSSAAYTLTISDISTSPTSFNLQTHSFACLPSALPAVQACYDFQSDVSIKENLYPKLTQLLHSHIPGVTQVVLFDYTVRLAHGPRQPVTQAHIDQTPASARARVYRHLSPSTAESRSKSRVRIINIWLPINGLVESFPLAFADSQTVADADLVAVEHRYPDWTGETYVVKYNATQKWYLWGDMADGDALLLQCYDSESGGRVAHAAVKDPRERVGAKVRESIEVRALVFS